VQLVVRIHPGELITKGPSVADVVRKVLPELPEHIHLVPAEAQINTYDIVEIAQLGLVYTTTVGMEMAMSGCRSSWLAIPITGGRVLRSILIPGRPISSCFSRYWPRRRITA
jgi:hypothetical protein